MSIDRNKFRTGRHVVYDLHAHVVLVTKYRRGAITDRVRATITEAAEEVATRLGFAIAAIDGEDDYIHLLIDYPPKLALSNIIMVLKTNTARHIRQNHFPEVEEKLWGKHFWSPSYFVASTGGAPLETVRAYVENQRKTPRKPGHPKRNL